MILILLSSWIWSSAQDHAVLVLSLNLVGFFISTRPRWSGRNVLYHSWTNFEGASRGVQPLNIHTWFMGAGSNLMYSDLIYILNTHLICSYVWICMYVHVYAYVCIYAHTYIYICICIYACIYAYICVYIYACIHVYIHTYIYITCVYIHVNIYTCLLYL